MRCGLILALAVVGSAGQAPVLAQCEPEEVAKLLGSETDDGDAFGSSVAIDGEILIAGSIFDEGPNNGLTGSAYVFRREGDQWVEEARLLASDGEGGDRFGQSVAIGGDWAVVGAYLADPNGPNSGAAYFFQRQPDTGEWKEAARMIPGGQGGVYWFGHSVAIAGDLAAVGAPLQEGDGRVHVYRLEGGAWLPEVVLFPPDSGGRFGHAVAASGDRVVVGAPHRQTGAGKYAGTVFVYRRLGQGQWELEAELTDPGAMAFDQLGFSVAIDGDVVLAGANAYDYENDVYYIGSASFFRFDGSEWVWEARMQPVDINKSASFGVSVALRADRASVGTTGVVYNYRYNKVWQFQAKALGSDSEGGDYFGASVATDGLHLAVGARDWHLDNGNPGRAYLFALPDQYCCPADLDQNGHLDLFDFLMFVNLFNAGDVEADCDGGGGLNLFDFLCFVNQFNEGCP